MNTGMLNYLAPAHIFLIVHALCYISSYFFLVWLWEKKKTVNPFFFIPCLAKKTLDVESTAFALSLVELGFVVYGLVGNAREGYPRWLLAAFLFGLQTVLVFIGLLIQRAFRRRKEEDEPVTSN